MNKSVLATIAGVSGLTVMKSLMDRHSGSSSLRLVQKTMKKFAIVTNVYLRLTEPLLTDEQKESFDDYAWNIRNIPEIERGRFFSDRGLENTYFEERMGDFDGYLFPDDDSNLDFYFPIKLYTVVDVEDIGENEFPEYWDNLEQDVCYILNNYITEIIDPSRSPIDFRILKPICEPRTLVVWQQDPSVFIVDANTGKVYHPHYTKSNLRKR